MSKEHAPYGLALQAKNLGFNEPCDYQWTYTFDLIHCVNMWGQPKQKTNNESQADSQGECISAPTYYQLMLWLLEKHQLYGIIIPTVTMFWTFKTMTVVEDMIEVPPYNHVHAYDYSTRQEAEIACLQQLIKMVEEK